MGRLVKVLIIFGIGFFVGKGSVSTDNVVKESKPIYSVVEEQDKTGVTQQENEEVKEEVKDELVVVEADDVKTGHKNAYNTAKKRVDNDAMSRSAVYKDLINNGYSDEEALYAVDECGIDWNDSCYRYGKFRLKYNNFSKKQLETDLQGKGFEQSEIEYALDKLGY